MFRALQRFGALLTVAGTAASLILAYDQWAGAAASDVRLALALLGSFALLGLVLLIWQEFRYARKTRTAEALPGLLRATQVTVGETLADESACKAALGDVAREASEMFSLMTGTRVSACIKIVKAELERGHYKFRVEDIARDPKSLTRNGRAAHGTGSKHWVESNSDFQTLFEHAGKPKGEYFLSGWLPGEWEYRNSSFAVHGGEPARIKFPLLREIFRDIAWPLPYKSTLVVPIRNMGPRPEDIGPLVGFFCIDSRARHAFSSRYDVPALELLAELAQPVLNKLITLSEAAQTGP